MPLFMNKTSNRICVEVNFIEKDDGLEIINQENADQFPNKQTEKFFFRAPNWGDVRAIMSSCSSIKQDGTMDTDLFGFVDKRIKCLIVDWSLKDDKGAKIPLTGDNIDQLPPVIITEISKFLEETPIISSAFSGGSVIK